MGKRGITVVTVALLAPALVAGVPPAAEAVFIGNVQGGADFPQGASSFADAIVSYTPVTDDGEPTLPHRVAGSALGVPDYAGDNNCTGDPSCTFVSLGNGGNIVLQFTDNVLTGSGNADPDLFVFEVGPDVEDTAVEVSTDGIAWSAVGSVGGSFSTVDLDAFGFGVESAFAFVRLTDAAGVDGVTGITVGADIDAVGAISTRLVRIPEPASLLVLALGLAVLVRVRRIAGR